MKARKWIDSAVVILFFAAILLFLSYAGTLTSGYHFIDDHEMIVIHSDLEKAPVLNVMANLIKKDLNIRFRPMYFVHRIIEIKIFGADFFTLSFYTGILAALTFSFFYLGARKLKFSALESLIFVLLAFIGSQMAIWWMLGPNETIGMFFLGLTFLFLAKSAERKNYLRDTVLFSVFLVFASLSKESFVIVIPAFVFYKIWNEKNIFGISLRESIQNNLVLLLPAAAMVFEIWMIYFAVGTNTIGYAGSTSGWEELKRGILAIITSKIMLKDWLTFFGIITFLFFLGVVLQKGEKKKKMAYIFKNILPSIIFSFLIVAPGILMYAKSGMAERYLLPSAFGLAFLAVFLVRENPKIFFRAAGGVIAVIFLLGSFKITEDSAKAFAASGIYTNQLLSAAIANSKPDAKILLAVDPVDRFEASDAIKTYLLREKRDNVFGYSLPREYKSDFEFGLEKGWESWYKGKMLSDMVGPPDMIIMTDKIQAERFFSETRLDKDDYKSELSADNPHALFIKK